MADDHDDPAALVEHGDRLRQLAEHAEDTAREEREHAERGAEHDRGEQ